MFAIAPAVALAAAAPAVTTTAATGVDTDSATLNGTVDPNLSPITDCHFEIARRPTSRSARAMPRSPCRRR